MSDLAVVMIPNGQMVQNCYLLADPAANQAVMVDPGEEAGRILAELEARGWDLTAIWLTHAHIDHILGVGPVKRGRGVPILLHPADRPLYDALPSQGEWFGMSVPPAPPPDQPLEDGQELRVGTHRFTVRHTPGHSPGSVSFLGPNLVLGGDVLFNGSIGRTDLPGGSLATLLHSIQTVFLPLADSTVIWAGHGSETTVGVERETNPFLTGVYPLG